MEKIINISLTKEGSKPEGSVSAGFRGEHKATALIFTPDSELLALIRATEAEGFEVVCRTDFALPSGEYFKGAEKEIEKISEPFYLTAPMTLSGLDGIAILSLLKKSGGEVVSELFKAQVKLSFEDSGLPYTPQAENESNKPTLDLAAFEQRVSEITELMEGKVAAVKGFADRSAAQLSRTVALADGLEQKTAEVEEKLQKGEFDGRDADTSAVANAVKGLAEGVGVEITDLSPLPHQVNLSLDKNLLAGTTFTDLPHIGYCRSDKTYPLVKGVSYLLKVKTKSGKQPLVVIEFPEWTSKTSPGYCFEASDTYSFDAFFSFDHLALFINLPAEDVLSAEICAAGDENLANLPVSVTTDGETQVYYTDQKGTVSFPSPSDMTLSAGKFYAIRASYNKDINKAFPTFSALKKKCDVEEWVHVDTITLSKDSKSVYVEKEPNGNPYNFKRLRVIITNPSVGSGNAYIAPSNQKSEFTASYYLLSHLKAYADLWIEFGYLWVKTYSGLGDYSQFQNCGKPISLDTIQNLRISGNGVILAGSTFEIWGVRNV